MAKIAFNANVASEDDSRRGLSGLWLRNIVGSSIFTNAIRGLLGEERRVGTNPVLWMHGRSGRRVPYVLGGFYRASAMNSIWRYDPIVNSCIKASPLIVERGYCKAGVLNNKFYVVGGVTRDHEGVTPLQSTEVYDPRSGTWSNIPSMPFTKAQVLPTTFLADLLKPTATGMTSYRGKLYVPQSLYCWSFFVNVGGEVYDPEANLWVEMPAGMGERWPARQAGSKLSFVVDEELYMLDPSSSLHSAQIKVYNQEEDVWKVIEGDVPIHEFTDAESPYLLTGFLGKLHVITKGVNHNISVMEADRRNRFDLTRLLRRLVLVSRCKRLMKPFRVLQRLFEERSQHKSWICRAC